MAKNKQNILRKTNISEMCAKCVVQKTVTFKFVITDIRNAKKKKKKRITPIRKRFYNSIRWPLFSNWSHQNSTVADFSAIYFSLVFLINTCAREGIKMKRN